MAKNKKNPQTKGIRLGIYTVLKKFKNQIYN